MQMQNLIRRSFTQVPNELINDKEMSRDARFLFVYLCSKPDNWKFYATVINDELNCSDDSRRKYLRELEAKGWITKVQTKNEKGEFSVTDITLNPYPIFSDSVNSPSPKSSGSVKTRSREFPTHNNTDMDNKTDLFNNTDELSLPHQILKFLNEKKGGRGFEFTSANLKNIKARLKEKFTVADCKKVIEASIVKWGDEPSMRQYIRPHTLFGDKFNVYLVEADDVINQKAKAKDTSDNNFSFNPTETAELK